MSAGLRRTLRQPGSRTRCPEPTPGMVCLEHLLAASEIVAKVLARAEADVLNGRLRNTGGVTFD